MRNCEGCNTGKAINHLCDCCRLVDGNHDQKKVMYCDFCGAYLCEACMNEPVKRAKAALIKGWERIKDFMK